MIIEFELANNPYVTSQEKGINFNQRKVYEKPEVAAMRYEYALQIRRVLRLRGEDVPTFQKAVRLKVTFYFKTADRRAWGRLKVSKPDCDNAIKLLQDVMADLGFFVGGDQQVAVLVVKKFWASSARVKIDVEEVSDDIYRVV